MCEEDASLISPFRNAVELLGVSQKVWRCTCGVLEVSGLSFPILSVSLAKTMALLPLAPCTCEPHEVFSNACILFYRRRPRTAGWTQTSRVCILMLTPLEMGCAILILCSNAFTRMGYPKREGSYCVNIEGLAVCETSEAVSSAHVASIMSFLETLSLLQTGRAQAIEQALPNQDQNHKMSTMVTSITPSRSGDQVSHLTMKRSDMTCQ